MILPATSIIGINLLLLSCKAVGREPRCISGLAIMTEYIFGKITELTPTQVVVENSGVGYVNEISLQTYRELEGKAEAKIWIQTQINTRDFVSVDYGFASKDERELFRLLISVNGMGAASARMMLSSLSPDELRESILSEDINRIKSVKGIGLKTAQRLILELKDKIVKGEGVSTGEELFAAASQRNAAAEEASAALVMLGFSKPAVSKAIQKILKDNPSAKVEDIIKTALGML